MKLAITWQNKYSVEIDIKYRDLKSIENIMWEMYLGFIEKITLNSSF